MLRPAVFSLLTLLTAPTLTFAEQHHGDSHHHHHDHHSGMEMDRDGMVMNTNSDQLPKDCREVAEDISITVSVGRKHALVGESYGYSEHSWRVPPCARITVRLINDDGVRHQWMVHGLPRYLYPQGMFHLEVSGGKEKQGTFIVPSDNETYLVHCDISQHMEKGLKGQLIVGSGGGDLPSIPGVTRGVYLDRY